MGDAKRASTAGSDESSEEENLHRRGCLFSDQATSWIVNALNQKAEILTLEY
jgi:hypothetical protein